MLYTEPLFIVLFTAGFTVGFGHCIGMCGPIVVSISLPLREKNRLFPLLFYNGGRVTTYSILGGIMGLTGSFIGVTTPIAGLQKGVMIFAGLLIIIMGIAMTGWIPVGKIFGDSYNPQGFISKGFKKITSSGSNLRYYPLGLLLGLLPCGPVYTALLTSARVGMEAQNVIGGIIKGSFLMFAFGVGTIPALLIIAKLSSVKWLKSRTHIYKLGSILMIVVGIYFVIKGILY